MNLIIEFLIFFTFIYLGYYLFIVKKIKEYNSKTCPKEILFLIRAYKLNIKKINYGKLLKTISLINAFIIAWKSVV